MLLLADGKIVIGGCFNQFNGSPRSRVARLNADGTLDDTFTPADTDPISGNTYDRLLTVQPDGKPILTGNSQNELGEQRAAFVRLNLDGLLDATFAGAATVNRFNIATIASALTRPKGGLVIAAFSQRRPDGTSGTLILRMDENGAIEPSGRPILLAAGLNEGGPVVRLFQSGFIDDPDRILVAGDFSSIDERAQPYLARLDLAATDQTSKLTLRLRELLAAEGENATVTLSRFGDVSAGTTVKFEARSATPDTLKDFVPIRGMVSFAPLETEKSILLPVPDDQTLDPERQIEVILSEPTGGASIAAGRAVVTIVDDELSGSIDPGFDAELDAPQDWGPVSVSSVRVLPDGRLLIGGNVETVHGQFLKPLEPLNADGSLDPGYIPPAGPPSTLAFAQPDGKSLGYVGERFVRRNADGTPDPSFSVEIVPLNSLRSAVVQLDGRIVVAGAFQSINGTPRCGVARLNSDGSIDPSFDPGEGPTPTNNLNPDIRALVLLQDGKIVLGGYFKLFNEIPRNGMVRLLADGRVDLTFDPPPATSADARSEVYSVLAQLDGRVLLLARFAFRPPTDSLEIVRLDPDGSLDSTFALRGAPRFVQPFNGYRGSIGVMALGPDNTLYVGGEFNRFGPLRRAGIVRVNLGPKLGPAIQSAGFNATGGFSMQIPGCPGQSYELQGSEDLVNWVTITVEVGAGGTLELLEPGVLDHAARFYRVLMR